MAIPISNVTRRQVYAPSGVGGIGPYAFTFEILANTDIAVFKDDTLLTLTTHYTVIINANGTGSVTITSAGLALAPVSPTQYAVVGNRTISRSTDFTTGGDFFANTLNDELDQQTIFAQQNAEGVARALQAPQTDPTTINMTLPRSSVRANKVLAFDASGNPSATEFIGSNRGNWAAGTLYFVRDIIKDTSTSNIFQVTVQHTSVGAQPLTTNAEAAKYFLLVDAAAAGASASAAAASASAAATSASNASTSASGAAASASTATTQASNASTSATTATNAATAASSSASTASTAATNAANSNTAAATSATNAANSATSASGSASTATTQASNASTSATNAAGSASTATTQASNASTSASGASTSASNASTSAGNASTSATAAAASAAAAASSFDAFDDIYLGAKASNPTLDNDGNPLTTGDQYFNTTANELRVFNGATFQAASTVGGTVNSLTVTGVTTVQAGTAALPAITTTGDTNTGIFFPAADTIAFSEGGAEAMRIDSSGNVGIGTNSPSTLKTTIQSNGAQLRIRNTTTRYRSDYAVDNAGTSSFATFDDTGAVFKQMNIYASPLTFNTTSAGAETVRIDSSGNMGIGTNLPTARLSVSGVTPLLAGGNGQLSVFSTDAIGADKGGKISFGGVSGATGFDPYGFCAIAGLKDNATASNFSGYLTFSTSTVGGSVTERMRIDSSGNVLVGTTTKFTGFTGGKVVQIDAANSGGLIIGTANSNGLLVYRDTVNNISYFFHASNSVQGSLSAAGAWINASDAKFKKEITTIKYGLETVLATKPRSYKHISVEGDFIGFIAQELKEQIPEVVSGNETVQYGVDYGSLVAVAFKAIQEQQALITTLTARLDAANL